MKIISFRILILCLATVIFACSKDDENVKTSPIKPGFTENTVIIQAPAKLKTATDEKAIQALSFIDIANGLTSNFSHFAIPAGAVATSDPITFSNGRTSAAAKYYVYTWGDAQSGVSLAYQVAEFNDRYTFELFMKIEAGSDWVRFIFAEENKTRTMGKFITFDPSSSDSASELIRYDWTRIGDNLTLNLTMDRTKYVYDVNTKTGAGTVRQFTGNILYYSMTWDAQGNGTWAHYNEDASVQHSGAWTA